MSAIPSSPGRGIFTQSVSLLGKARDVAGAGFRLICRSGDEFHVQTSTETNFTVLRNMDDLDRDRIPNPPHYDPARGPAEKVRK
jgi:hypothetical protein